MHFDTRQSALPRWSRLATTAIALGLLFSLTGCSELMHWGQIRDQETAASIGGARIEQQEPDGSWKLLATTDGKGGWEIFKANVQGGGAVRITKPGYYTLHMPESEFMSSNNLIMTPTGGGGTEDGLEKDTRRMFPLVGPD